MLCRRAASSSLSDGLHLTTPLRRADSPGPDSCRPPPCPGHAGPSRTRTPAQVRAVQQPRRCCTEQPRAAHTASRSSSGSCWITIAKLRETLFNTSAGGTRHGGQQQEWCAPRLRSVGAPLTVAEAQGRVLGQLLGVHVPLLQCAQRVSSQDSRATEQRRSSLAGRAFTMTRYGSAPGSESSMETRPILLASRRNRSWETRQDDLPCHRGSAASSPACTARWD